MPGKINRKLAAITLLFLATLDAFMILSEWLILGYVLIMLCFLVAEFNTEGIGGFIKSLILVALATLGGGFVLAMLMGLSLYWFAAMGYVAGGIILSAVIFIFCTLILVTLFFWIVTDFITDILSLPQVPVRNLLLFIFLMLVLVVFWNFVLWLLFVNEIVKSEETIATQALNSVILVLFGYYHFLKWSVQRISNPGI